MPDLWSADRWHGACNVRGHEQAHGAPLTAYSVSLARSLAGKRRASDRAASHVALGRADAPLGGGALLWWGDVDGGLDSRHFLVHNAGVDRKPAKNSLIDVRAKRIEHIRSLQDKGEWHGQRSVIELSAEWNVSRDVVLGLVTVANRELEEAEGTPAAVRSMVIRRYTEILRTGKGLEVVKAGEALTKLVGANAPSVDLATYVRSLSLEDRRAFCQRIIQQAQEILASLPAIDSSEPSSET